MNELFADYSGAHAGGRRFIKLTQQPTVRHLRSQHTTAGRDAATPGSGAGRLQGQSQAPQTRTVSTTPALDSFQIC